MYFNIKNLISLILYIYNNLAADILLALIEKNNNDGENNVNYRLRNVKLKLSLPHAP